MPLSSVALLSLLISSSVVGGSAVTGCHGDRDKDHRPRENCTAAGFSHVPPGIEPTTQVLLFPLNRFSSVTWSSFSVFKDLYEIDLSQNQVPSLPPSETPVLPSLSVLRLGSNFLRSVPEHGFTVSPALTKLYLQNNTISSISDTAFSGLSRLEILDLSKNQIQTLPPTLMFPLSSIKTLYLEENKIALIPDGWFSRKPEVHYLFLWNNPWSCSCPLTYLHSYLDEYEANVYVRDGTILRPDAESVVCDSPRSLKGRAVVDLHESDFCNDEASPAPSTAATVGPLAPTVAGSTAYDGLATQSDYRVVTWYEAFTRVAEWKDFWETLRGDGRAVRKTTAHPEIELATTTFPTTAHQTSATSEIVTRPTTLSANTTLAEATTAVSTKLPSSTLRMPISTPFDVQVSPTDMTPSMSTVSNAVLSRRRVSMVREVFCFWSFVGCVFLCIVSAVSSLKTAMTLWVWHRGVYKTLKCVIVGREQVRMLTYGQRFDQAQARYRTMLFVKKDAECFVNLGRKDGNVEKSVYRQTMYRVVGREEGIVAEGVLAGCSVSSGARGASERACKKRYSVILREVSDTNAGGTERHEWAVGGWETETGAGPQESWGAWLGQYLPSMPWGVSAPPKSEAEGDPEEHSPE